MGFSGARIALCCCLLAATGLGAAAARADDADDADDVGDLPRYHGPLELQDNFLPAQVRHQPVPESARVLPRGGFEARVVGDWTNHLAHTDTYLFDGESVTTTLRLRGSPFDDVELGLDFPWTDRFEGTLDRFIEFVERSADSMVEDRFNLPRDQYEAIILDDRGMPRLILDEENGVGDLTLRVKGQLLRTESHGLDLALAGHLALPTGEDTFGGEGLSPGLGLHLQRPFRLLNLFLGGVIQYHSDAREQDFRLAAWRPMGYAGFEWRPARWFGFLGEYQLYGPLARSERLLDDNAHYAAGAFRFYIGSGTLIELMVVENLIENENSSDVTFKLALGQRF
jgi:hypothetical protein